MPITIAIVDDHILIAKALASIISKLGTYDVLYEVENGLALMERFKLQKNIPDIVLLDVSMPLMNGFETAAWLKEHHPSVYVMALSMQNDDESLIKMIKSGAHGYLLKDIQPNDLDNALKQMLKQGFYYPDWATGKILNSIRDGHKNVDEKRQFTERETELLKYVCTELSWKEIADKMFCSPRTVEGYRDSLFEKLNLKTRVGLAVYAMKHNLA